MAINTALLQACQQDPPKSNI